MSRLLNCSMGFAAVVAGAAVQAQTSSAEDFTSAVKIQGAITQNASGNNVKQDLNVGSAQKSRATSFKADVTTGNITQTGKNGARQTINVGGMNNSKADRFDARVTTGNIEQVANRGERQELDIGSVSNSTVAGTARTRVSVGNVKQTGEGDIALGALKNANVQQFQSNLSVKGKIEGNNIRMGSLIGQDISAKGGRHISDAPATQGRLPALAAPRSTNPSQSAGSLTSKGGIIPSQAARSNTLAASAGRGDAKLKASTGGEAPILSAPSQALISSLHNSVGQWQDHMPGLASILDTLVKVVAENGIERVLDDTRSVEIFEMIFSGTRYGIAQDPAERLKAFEEAMTNPTFRQDLDKVLTKKLGAKLSQAAIESVAQGLLIHFTGEVLETYYSSEAAEFFRLLAPATLSLANLAATATSTGVTLGGVAATNIIVWSENMRDFYRLGVELAQSRSNGTDMKTQLANAAIWNASMQESLIKGELSGPAFADHAGKPLSDGMRKAFEDSLSASPALIEQMTFADQYLGWLQVAAERFANTIDQQKASFFSNPITAGGGGTW
jgi:hypothetical protein